MWLNLDLDGINFFLNIKYYTSNHPDDPCQFEITLESIDFKYTGNFCVFLYEVDSLRDSLNDIINTNLSKEKIMQTLEEDLDFIFLPQTPDTLRPKSPLGCFDMRMHFIKGWATDNYISLRFKDDNLKALYTYLRMITHELSKNSSEIENLITLGIIKKY